MRPGLAWPVLQPALSRRERGGVGWGAHWARASLPLRVLLQRRESLDQGEGVAVQSSRRPPPPAALTTAARARRS